MTTYFVGNYYEQTGSTITKYYYAGTQRVATRHCRGGTCSAPTYLLTDQLGSTSLTTDASGNVISELRYTAWGQVRYTSGTTPTNYTYTGQYSDSYINLLWYSSREYDPSIGRFISPDSIVPTTTQGVQAWDRYAYTNNNPVTYNDPSGHCIEDACVLEVITVVAAVAVVEAATAYIMTTPQYRAAVNTLSSQFDWSNPDYEKMKADMSQTADQGKMPNFNLNKCLTSPACITYAALVVTFTIAVVAGILHNGANNQDESNSHIQTPDPTIEPTPSLTPTPMMIPTASPTSIDTPELDMPYMTRYNPNLNPEWR